MGPQKKKYSVKLNNVEKIEELLQETYDLACRQHAQIQDEINKIANSTKLSELEIDGKEKYGKIMNNYLALQQKATAQKFDIAKLMAEVVKHGGDVNGALGELGGKGVPTSLDLTKLREIARNASTPDNDSSQKYNIKG
jgi:hypothetical protein